MKRKSFFCGFFFFGCFLGLCGCGSKIPTLHPVSAAKAAQVRTDFATLAQQKVVIGLDADITVKVGGEEGIPQVFPAMLQLRQQPVRLRADLVDPLGRSVMLLFADEQIFTLLDNREASGYQGKVGGDYWQHIIPSALANKDLLAWLSGTILNRQTKIEAVGREHKTDSEANNRYWLRLSNQERAGKDRLAYYLQFTSDGKQLSRRLMSDETGDILLAADYEYEERAGLLSAWPRQIHFTGDALLAPFTLVIKKIYSLEPPELEMLTPKIPAHYQVESVP